MEAYFVDEAECGSWMVHEPHSFRTGFMWLTKKECAGQQKVDQSEALVPLTIIEHKHNFKLVAGFQFGPDRSVPKNDLDILWRCDWLGCTHLFVVDRDLWHEQGAPYDVY